MKIPDLSSITPNQSRECQLRKNYPEFCSMLDKDKDIDSNLPFTERMWLKINGLTEAPKCPVCGNQVKFKSLVHGYKSACSRECSNKNTEKIEKTKKNNIEKFGVSAPAKNKDITEKIKQTCISRYGVDNPLKNKEVHEKMMATCIERHGGLGNASDSAKEKQKKTMLERYGAENAANIEEFREKTRKTLVERYGAEITFKSEEIKKKCRGTLVFRYGVDSPMKSDKIKEKAKKTNLERYGAEWFCQTKEFNASLSNDSKANLAFANILKCLEISFDREFPIENRRYDFKVGETLIEINPTATHNSSFGIKGKDPVEKTYHIEKTNLAEEHGFSCIHVWDWDDPEMIAKSLLHRKTVYARDCRVTEVSISSANKFIEENHFQGKCRGTETAVGLEFDGELVAVMTFGKSRYNKNYSKELLRLCFKSGIRVTGGAAKMFKFYVENHNPESVISYCDRSKFTGKVYETLGFKLLRHGTPSLHWCNGKTHIRESMLLKLGFDKIFGTDYGKGTDNRELMRMHRYAEVYDCGQDLYVYSK